MPNSRGFDEWFGTPRTADETYWPEDVGFKDSGVTPEYIMEGRKGEASRNIEVYDFESRRRIDAEATRRTIDFMKRSVTAGKPFYAYVPLTQVHYPALPHPDFACKTGFGNFPDSLAEMDFRVGQRWHISNTGEGDQVDRSSRRSGPVGKIASRTGRCRHAPTCHQARAGSRQPPLARQSDPDHAVGRGTRVPSRIVLESEVTRSPET